MKSIAMLFASAFIALSSATVQAQNYYVCDTGDDNNDGKSVNTPFKSHSKAIEAFNKMDAGDSVLFCRGGVFPVDKKTRIFNPACSAQGVCTIADYGDSFVSEPTLVVSDKRTALNFQDGGNADRDGGYLVKNLIITAKEYAKGKGVFVFNDVDDLTMENITINGLYMGMHLAGNNALGSANGQNERFHLKNSVISNNAGQGFLGGCSDCVIEDNLFENNGYRTKIFHHNLYFNSPSKHIPVKNVIIRGNTLYKNAIVNGECTSTSLVVHGLVDDLTIENNIVKEDVGAASAYCWGISVDPGYKTEEAFHSIRITGNQLLNVGNVAIGCASCKDLVITKNIIVDDASVLRAGIKVPVRAEDKVKSSNVKVTENTVMLSHTKGVGVSIGGSSPFHVSGNQITQAENSSEACIERKEANSDTDVSGNICTTEAGVSLIDDATGKAVDTSDVSAITEITRGNYTKNSQPNQEVVEPISNINYREVSAGDSQLSIKTASNTINQETTITTNDDFTGDSQVISSLVTYSDVRSSIVTPQDSLNEESCRAYARGRCLLR